LLHSASRRLITEGLKTYCFWSKAVGYVHQKKLLEAELLGEFSTAEKSEKELKGNVRLIGYSNIFTTYNNNFELF
jgi:hypothetical protein